MAEFLWGTSPEGENEAARAARERQREFERELDNAARQLGITPQSERKGVKLEKDNTARQMFTGSTPRPARKEAAPEKDAARRQAGAGNPPPHDSAARRQALQAHLEKIGISPELRAIRDLVELGQATPPTAALEHPDRRDPNSRGAAMRAREREERERGISRGD